MSNSIREVNDEFLGRIPVEGWVEALVGQLVETFRSESKILRDEIAEVRTELREAREQARTEKEALMATLADDQAADTRLQDAVAVRDAREKATITAQEGQISAQEGQISAQEGQIAALKASEVPDDVVQKKHDLAAQIEAENTAAEAAAAGGQGSSAGATAGTSGQGAATAATV